MECYKYMLLKLIQYLQRWLILFQVTMQLNTKTLVNDTLTI